MKSEVIIVGSKELHNYFTQTYTNWDTQIVVPTANDVWEGLENKTLSETSSVIIFSDADLSSPEEFSNSVEAIATFASEATVIVLFYDINNHNVLFQAVKQSQRDLSLELADYFPVDATSENLNEQIANAFQSVATGQQQDMTTVPVQQEYKENVAPNPNQSYAPKRGMIVASTSSKGGSGKTTVGLLTAAMISLASRKAVEQGLREKPLSVCIVDMDTHDGQIGFILRQISPTALNVFLAENKTKDVISDNLVEDNNLGIKALLAPRRARTADFLTPEFYQHIITELSEMFDVVVLDTNVSYTDTLLSEVVFPMANAILFVTNLSVGSVYGMNRWMDQVVVPASEGGPGISLNKVGVVVNQSAPNMGIDEDLLRRAAGGAEMLAAIPLDTTGVVSASNMNKLADILLHHPEISPAYLHIAKQLLPEEQLVSPLIVQGGPGVNPPHGGNIPPVTKGSQKPASAPAKRKFKLF